MRAIATLLVVLMACSHGPRTPTVTGFAIYTHAAELRRDGAATVTATDQRILEIRKYQYLRTSDREQVFLVEQVIENCKGGDATVEVDCTIALLLDKRFTLHDQPPGPPDKKPPSKYGAILKGMVATAIVGTVFIVGAVRCDTFHDCRDLAAGGAIVSGLVMGSLVAMLISKLRD